MGCSDLPWSWSLAPPTSHSCPKAQVGPASLSTTWSMAKDQANSGRIRPDLGCCRRLANLCCSCGQLFAPVRPYVAWLRQNLEGVDRDRPKSRWLRPHVGWFRPNFGGSTCISEAGQLQGGTAGALLRRVNWIRRGTTDIPSNVVWYEMLESC